MSDKPYRHGLLAGMYDPVTVGHMELIKRASRLCDRVSVGVFQNADKSATFAAEQRAAFIRLACADLANVEVFIGEGYVAHRAAELGADVLIRGVRNDTDRAYEEKMRVTNLSYGGPDTLLLDCSPELANISSTAVRSMLGQGKDPSELLPDGAGAEILRAYRIKNG